MRILWSVNTVPPELANELKMRSTHAISWVDAMSRQLKRNNNIKLAIVANGGRHADKLVSKEIDNIIYYVLPNDFEKNDYWSRILEEFEPDVIHAYGTELRHNITLIEKYKAQYPIMISLQGIINEYEKYYYAGMSMKDILSTLTIGDIIFFRSIIAGKRKFKKQSEYEHKMISNVDYVEGRSDWDRVYSRKINRNLKYYHCPRMIRSEFFGSTWDSEKHEPFSILVHQGNYPIKGFHKIVEALFLLKEDYPGVKMYISGNSANFNPDTLKRKLLYNGYTKYIKKLIDQYGLWENIEFTGYLNAEQMAKKLSYVNVCVIPSAIENAPNSLAEAMIVGTPCVASYAGGSPEMLNNGECGFLYRYEEPEMLAHRISRYFSDPECAKTKSENAVRVSRSRHDPDTLVKRIIDIYTSVVSDFKNKENQIQ